MKKTSRWCIAQYFELLWWKRYLKNKDIDSYLIWKKNYWANLLQQIEDHVQPAKGMHILDAGCGPAGIFMAIGPHQVTAIDPLLDKYRSEIDHFNPAKYPHVKFRTVTLEHFNETEQFDLVFCLNAINHVSDLEKAFLRLYQSAKKGSRIVVSIDAHNHSFIKRLFRLQPGDILHPHQYDLQEYQQMLTRLNCSILQTLLIKREFLFNHYLLVAHKN